MTLQMRRVTRHPCQTREHGQDTQCTQVCVRTNRIAVSNRLTGRGGSDAADGGGGGGAGSYNMLRYA